MRTAPCTGRETFKTVALFATAPFLGLAYIVVLPFAGLGVLGWALLKALCGKRTLKTVRDIALFFAAPFIGLAYIVLLPVAGLVMLVVIEFKATNAGAHAEAVAAA